MKLLGSDSTGLTQRHIARNAAEKVDHMCSALLSPTSVIWFWLKDGDHLSVER